MFNQWKFDGESQMRMTDDDNYYTKLDESYTEASFTKIKNPLEES